MAVRESTRHATNSRLRVVKESEIHNRGLVVLLGYVRAFGRPVNGDHPPGVEHPGSQDRELSRRPASPNRDRVSLFDTDYLSDRIVSQKTVGDE
jgi:hypothetical protein